MSQKNNNKQNEKNPNFKESAHYLSEEKVKEMLMKFLLEKGMSKEDLARALQIQVVDLEKLLCCQASSNLLAAINLPLVMLYCSTEFNDM